jgi:tRNA A22 N-methylase
MGGREILEIAMALGPQLGADDRLIISPHRKVLELREGLHYSDYRLEMEGVILENEQFYPYLVLSKETDRPLVGLYGDIMWTGLIGLSYLNHQILHFECHQDVRSKAFVAYLRSLNRP